MVTTALAATAAFAAIFAAGRIAEQLDQPMSRPARSFLDTAQAAEMCEIAETIERIARATSGARVRR